MSISELIDKGRSYFSMRWLLPGLSFLLPIIIINYPLLQNIQLDEVGSTLLIVLIIPGIGFLTSQLWYVPWNSVSGTYGQISNPRPFVTLFTNSDVLNSLLIYNSSNPIRKDKKIVTVCADVLTRIGGVQNTRSYEYRRWDLMHILGSSSITIIMGSIIGNGIQSLNILNNETIWIQHNIYYVPFAVFMTLSALFYIGYKRCNNDWENIMTFQIYNGILKNKSNFNRLFPPTFYDNNKTATQKNNENEEVKSSENNNVHEREHSLKNRLNVSQKISLSVYGFLIALILKNAHGWGWLSTYPFHLNGPIIFGLFITVASFSIPFLLYWDSKNVLLIRRNLASKNRVGYILTSFGDIAISFSPYFGYALYLLLLNKIKVIS